MKPTAEQWARYEADLKDHRARMQKLKPVQPDPRMFQNEQDFIDYMDRYRREYAEWEKSFHMDAPNKPGYEFANND